MGAPRPDKWLRMSWVTSNVPIWPGLSSPTSHRAVTHFRFPRSHHFPPEAWPLKSISWKEQVLLWTQSEFHIPGAPPEFRFKTSAKRRWRRKWVTCHLHSCDVGSLILSSFLRTFPFYFLRVTMLKTQRTATSLQHIRNKSFNALWIKFFQVCRKSTSFVSRYEISSIYKVLKNKKLTRKQKY